MSGYARDLAAIDPWEASLQRSRARRQRGTRRGGKLAGVSPVSLAALMQARREAARDLADSETWELSLGRSRARRRARQLRFVPGSTRARRASLGALVALSAAPIAGLLESSGGPSLASAAPLPPEPTTTTRHYIVLRQGDEGRQVRLLQTALGIKVDGDFGPETQAAVERYQATRGLTADGIVGPETSRALANQAPPLLSGAAVIRDLTGETRETAPGQVQEASYEGAEAPAAGGTAYVAPATTGTAPAGETAPPASPRPPLRALADNEGAGETATEAATASPSPSEAPSGETAAGGTAAPATVESATEVGVAGPGGESEGGEALEEGEAVQGTQTGGTTQSTGTGHAATGETSGSGGQPQTNHAAGEQIDASDISSHNATGTAGTNGAPGTTSAAAREAHRAAIETEAVRHLQSALGVAVDGEFGPETESALRHFQAAHGLEVDGVPGPHTWSALGQHDEPELIPPPSAMPHPPAHRHNTDAAQHGGELGGTNALNDALHPVSHGQSKGEAVRRLQSALGVAVDGEFGPETESAVRRFQADHGLEVDGEVGPQTWGALGVHGAPELKPPAWALPHHSTAPGAGAEPGGASSSTGDAEGIVARVIAAANEIATRPYVYGGGHGSFISEGYDCSGSVSYALHGGGLLSAPEDSTALESYGEPGPGRYITIYANAEHAWMTIDGRRYDTVALAEDGSRWGGPSDDGGGFVERHPDGL